MTPNENFRAALLAYGKGDYAIAAQHAQAALDQSPHSRVFAEAVKYLNRVQREGKSNVYVSPEAFGAFIRGGGNVPLYENTSAALKRVYGEYDSLSLIDIGTGDMTTGGRRRSSSTRGEMCDALSKCVAHILLTPVLDKSCVVILSAISARKDRFNHTRPEMARRNSTKRTLEPSLAEVLRCAQNDKCQVFLIQN